MRTESRNLRWEAGTIGINVSSIRAYCFEIPQHKDLRVFACRKDVHVALRFSGQWAESVERLKKMEIVV